MSRFLIQPIVGVDEKTLTKKGKDLLIYILDNMENHKTSNGIDFKSLTQDALLRFDIDFGSEMEKRLLR